MLDLFAQQQLSTLLLVVLAAFGTALFHAISGFAGGLILSVCLAPILGVKAVIPVVSVAMVISNSNRLWLFREAVDWRVYRAVMITALPGIIIGALIYVYLPVEIIAVLLGASLAGERFGAHELGAMAVVLAGVVAITLARARKAPAPVPPRPADAEA